MSHAIDAFQLLSADTNIEAVKQAKHLVTLNKSRKIKAQSLVQAAEAKLNPDSHKNGILVIGDETWSPTLVGPVASNMVRKFQMPVFVYGCEDGDVYRGSCRSVTGMSVVEIMSHVTPGFFNEFGGHAMSGGFGFEKDKVHVFEQEMINAFNKWKELKETGVSPDLAVTINEAPVYTLTHDQITDGFVMDLGKLKPFGMGNEKPLFHIQDVTLRELKKFGKAKEHVEFVIGGFKDKDGVMSDARPDFLEDLHLVSPVRYISFFSDQSHHDALIGTVSDVYGYIEESFFLGKREIRVRVDKIITK
jgi:single-stranded-DNA-specific exonuclease